MTSFKCKECESFWTEGPTRDHRTDQLCRLCLNHKLKVIQRDARDGLAADTRPALRQSLTVITAMIRDSLA